MLALPVAQTRFILIDEHGTQLVQHDAQGSNKNSVTSQVAKQRCQQGLKDVITKLNSQQQQHKYTLDSVVSLCAGMSGCNTEEDAAEIAQWFRELLPQSAEQTHDAKKQQQQRVHVFNDSVAALLAGTKGRRHGLVLISGTGMIVHACNEELSSNSTHGCVAQHTSCGNGSLLDWGSGYQLGLQLLQACCHIHDGMHRWLYSAADGVASEVQQQQQSASNAAMLRDVLAHCECSTAEQLIPWLYAPTATSDWSRVAALTPILFMHASTTDESSSSSASPTANRIALQILQRNVDYLLAACLNSLQHCFVGSSTQQSQQTQGTANTSATATAVAVPVVLHGGCAQHPLMQRLIEEQLHRRIQELHWPLTIQVQRDACEAAIGAALWAKQQAASSAAASSSIAKQ